MTSRSHCLLPVCLALANCVFAQSEAAVADSAEPPASPAAIAPGQSVKPGTAWGTIITRDQFKPLTGKERWGLYWRQSYATPTPYISAFGSAVGSHLDNNPRQWGDGAEGYFKRVGDRFARARIRSSIEAVGSAALQHDVRYVRCDCTGVLRRTGHAVAMNFITLNKNGNYVPHVSRIGGAFAAEFIGNTWMPPGYRDKPEALRGIGLQFAFGSLFNTVREFSPEIKRLLRRD